MQPAAAVPPPPPTLNGGLYTGEPFAKGAPWGNVPVVPDAGYLIHHNLRSANPPPGALYQYPGSIRPGNSSHEMYGIMKLEDRPYNLYCIDDTHKRSNDEDMHRSQMEKNNQRFSKYYYI